MKKFAKKIRMRRRTAAFTLVEMMVVVVVIAILIAGVFRLMKAVDMKNREAQTKARLQRIQNAISAFYAEYGTYPPVAYYGVPDPYVEQGDPYQDYSAPISVTELTAENAVRAARCQPTEYLYPTPRKWDAGINRMFREKKAVSVNDALAGTVQNHPDTRWNSATGIRAFRFGLLSFLLPRFTLMGGKDDGTLTAITRRIPVSPARASGASTTPARSRRSPSASSSSLPAGCRISRTCPSRAWARSWVCRPAAAPRV